MGAAPSTELLRQAPFRPPHSSPRQIALIPFTMEYFPSANCELFKQFYEARMDPSVRYYLRYDLTSGDTASMRLDRHDHVPPIEHNHEQLFNWYMDSAPRLYYKTNAALRADVEAGNEYRVRPVPCAVAFLYDGAAHVPEGSVRLSSCPGDVYVRVIGGIGDVSSFVAAREKSTFLTKDDDLKVQMFITKSAGDHNMTRVLLLACYTYQHQCLDIIGLSRVPTLPTTFMSFKTNIPFLCVLRELRDRVATELEASQVATMWLDESYIHGYIQQSYVRKLITAFTKHYVQFIESKAQHKTPKQHHKHPQTGSINGSEDAKSPNGSLRSGSTDDLFQSNGDGIHHERESSTVSLASTASGSVGSFSTQSFISHPQSSTLALVQLSSIAPKTKVSYLIKGYITHSTAIISAWSGVANEVYVVCTDSTVTVTEAEDEIPLHSGVLSKPSIEPNLEVSVSGIGKVVETLLVRRGDILTFRDVNGVPIPDSSANEEINEDNSAPAAAKAVGEETEKVVAGANVETTSKAVSDESTENSKSEKRESERVLGRWVVNPTVFIENVLLSLVRDECKCAREADPDDSRWVHSKNNDGSRGEVVHDGPFYIWHFHRNDETFYYGTVPKFANQGRRAGFETRNGNSNINGSSSLSHYQQHMEVPPSLLAGSISSNGAKSGSTRIGTSGSSSNAMIPQQRKPGMAKIPPPPPYTTPAQSVANVYAASSMDILAQQQHQQQQVQQLQQQQLMAQWGGSSAMAGNAAHAMAVGPGRSGTMDTFGTAHFSTPPTQAISLPQQQPQQMQYSYVLFPEGQTQLVYNGPASAQGQLQQVQIAQPQQVQQVQSLPPYYFPQQQQQLQQQMAPANSVLINGQLYVQQNVQPQSIVEAAQPPPPSVIMQPADIMMRQGQQQQQQHQQKMEMRPYTPPLMQTAAAPMYTVSGLPPSVGQLQQPYFTR